ncbi:Iron-sulfur cluster biosynthesis family protein [Zea mays]|uniref:Iron-sulfur cluster biosynthesis family protein n=1 Tax=Zea mays TaxID=4577 RepID=A0A1D6H9Y0_MAIZE|nr:Iron-sulfur cluster biosynthesis family protein [Zea mays]
MAAAAAISLSFHFRFRPPFPSPRTPTRHAPFSLFSPSLLAPCRLRVAPGRPSPSPWRPDVRARAGSTIGAPPALVRPGGAVETDRLPSDVRDRAMEAVDHFGGRVTIGDVASRAGLQLAQAERALQALAADTEGFLEVSEDGEVLYVFPKDYRAKLAGKSFRMRVEPLVDKAKQVGAYLVRVSFGTALIASIVLVYTTIIAILSSSSTSSSTSSDEDGRGRRRRSYGSTIIIPTDMFWYLDADYYRRRRVENENGMNFIESVFSFVFGDGDPNDGLEEKRWKMVFPFSFEKILDSIFHQMVELLQLKNWHHFLMCHLHQKSPRHGNSCPKTMNHLFFQFFYAFRDIQKLMSRQMTVTPGGLISFAAQLYPLLQIYAGSFFAIPLFRWFLLRKTNNGIKKRNKAREQRAQELVSPDSSLRRKLLSARDMAERKVITPEEIVYTTEKDLLEQDYEVKEWERRFKELESE